MCLCDWNFGWTLVVLHTKISMFGKSWGHARSRCWGLNAKLFILVHRGPNSYSDPKRCQNEFGPQWTDIESSFFNPLHRLQACPQDLPNMKIFICKTMNLRPKLGLNWQITLIYCLGFQNPQGFVLYQIQCVPLEQENRKKQVQYYSGVKDWVWMVCCVNNRDLHGNGLSGDIPAELSQFQYLTYLWAFLAILIWFYIEWVRNSVSLAFKA